jgi:hypothetical protein
MVHDSCRLRKAASHALVMEVSREVQHFQGRPKPGQAMVYSR